MTLPPIEHAYTLGVSPAVAFAAYTGAIGRWWHPEFTRDAGTLIASQARAAHIVGYQRQRTCVPWGVRGTISSVPPMSRAR